MKKIKVVFFGCSFSIDLGEVIDGRSEFSHIDYDIKAIGGNANQHIITQVYDYINSDEYHPSDILNIQYSYTNRFWTPSRLKGAHHSFHGLHGGQLTVKNSHIDDKLNKFIELYTMLFFDNKLYFEHHLKQVDLLQTYLESRNVKYVHYLHSVNSHYWEVSKNKDGWNAVTPYHNTEINSDLSKFNFITFEGERCLGEWVTNKDYQIRPTNNHINIDGKITLLRILDSHWQKL